MTHITNHLSQNCGYKVRSIQPENEYLKRLFGERVKYIFMMLVTIFLLQNNLELSAEHNSKTFTYTVKSGDSLYKISRETGISINDIIRINNLKGNNILIGQHLIIPTTASRQQATNVVAKQVVKTSAVYSNSNQKKHIVKRGDTLFGISKKYGIPVKQIINENKLNSTTIRSGQLLTISNKVDTEVESKFKQSEYYQNNYQTNTNQKISNYELQAVWLARNEFSMVKSNQGNFSDRNTYNIYHRSQFLANVSDNIQSRYAVNSRGIQYNDPNKISYYHIRNYGFSHQVANALAFASSNEGGPSALNFYDGAGSFGFIQFTLKYGSFAKFVSHLKENDYLTYKNYLVRYGIRLENGFNKYGEPSEELVVYAPEGYRGITRITGDLIFDYIIDHKTLYGPLILLGQNTTKIQIESAYQQYYKSAENLQINLFGYNKNLSVSNLLETTAGMTALTDLCVKLGEDGTKRLIEKTINSLLISTSFSIQGLYNLNDNQIIQAIINNSDDLLVKRRLTKLIYQQQQVL
ncbi:LysM peptidoglycan-binding domain-containing protein [Flexithrix dorotheae]|uniref:LysM peptidoglycan-binding domain-containing protein n=1 Tax=Flexithrix dorotheae TaxID=70993 RepID=UPI000381E758|nr:LysM peptidoglycan-binding domain-containing protein [Flexithrix dorotheae]